MKTQSTEKMRILALAQYYVERYNLPVDEDAEPSERYAKYVRSLRRLMEKKKIDGKSVWEIIKPKGKAREISIDGFESLFFADWSKYLKRQNKDDSINLIQLELDSIAQKLTDFLGPGYTDEEKIGFAHHILNSPYFDPNKNINEIIHQYLNSLGMTKFEIPCHWTVCGTIPIYAPSAEVAYDHVETFHEELTLPTISEHLENSLELEERETFLDDI